MHDQCPDCESFELETVENGSGANAALTIPEEGIFEEEKYQICRVCGWEG
ncbi:hypothetical protein [Paenibacillus gallinarum]|nr:hypothetical protein [Paenibacillus gallinarum]